MTSLSRRALLLSALAAASALPAFANEETYRGWSMDLSPADPANLGPLRLSIQKQIDLVEAIRMREDIKSMFRATPLTIDPNLKGGGFVLKGKLSLRDETIPEERPVLLHELLHIYHNQRLPQGVRNPMILAWFREARTAGYAANAYMLSNPAEYFATVVSTVLAGKAERPPFTRERVKDLQPDFHDWIVFEFGLRI
jgi:hypothetical protein